MLGTLVPLALIFLVVLYMRNRRVYPWSMDRIYDQHREHERAMAMWAGQGPPPPPLPWGYRAFTGVFPPGPPTGPVVMRGTPMPPGFGTHPPPVGYGPLSLHPAVTGMPPPMQPSMTGMPPMQPSMTGLPPLQFMQPGMTGVRMQPQPTGMPPPPPGLQPGLPPQFTGRPPAPYPGEFGGMAPGHTGYAGPTAHRHKHHPHASSSSTYRQARQEIMDIMGGGGGGVGVGHKAY